MSQQLHSDLDWMHPNPFTLTIRVASEDTDRLGHTNNVVYLKWFEDISWRHIEPLGMGWNVQDELGKAMAIVRTEIDYLASSYAGDELILGTWMTQSDQKLNSSRMFQLIRLADRKTLVKALSNYVCIDLKTGKPTRMPKVFCEAHAKGLASWQSR